MAHAFRDPALHIPESEASDNGPTANEVACKTQLLVLWALQ